MNGINEAVILGHLGAEPEVRNFNDGGKITILSVATSDSWTDKSGQKQENTEWHRVILRGGLAKTAETYLKKGSKVYISGAMKTRKYTDQTGVDRYITEIIGLKLNMLDGAPSNNNEQQTAQRSQDNQQTHQQPQSQTQPTNPQNQAAPVNKNITDIDDSIPFDV